MGLAHNVGRRPSLPRPSHHSIRSQFIGRVRALRHRHCRLVLCRGAIPERVTGPDMTRPFRLARSLFLLEALLTTWACSSSPSAPSPALTGIWGGDHIALTVADTGTH